MADYKDNPDSRHTQSRHNDPSPSDIEDLTLVSEEDLSLLKTEADIFGEDEEQTANRLLRQALPQAVLSIVKIANTGQSEATRLRAATYIVERNLGRLQDVNPNKVDDPLMQLSSALAGAVEYMEDDIDS